MHFKIADRPAEFEAIHRLNYRTFVEEIPQHPRNPERRLVDRFHAENRYAICLDEGELVGMVCGRAQRPFSLDQKLSNLDAYLPEGRRVFEIRLLAVDACYRRPGVFAGLAGLLARSFRDQGFDLAVISGTTRQLKLYRHLGFVPFGPLVGTGEARFQPMYLTLESFVRRASALARDTGDAANYLCGPVQVREEVRNAFSAPPISHRSARFHEDFEATRALVCELTRARHVELLLGSGTLANDAVAAQLALAGDRGLVLSNGEFGERLVDHARRHGLRFDTLRAPWGAVFDYGEVHKRLAADAGLRWVWAVHCETSTGVLNDMESLKRAAFAHGAKLCMDCISSIGSLPLDLEGVHLATAVSGKALGSYTGVAMVFHDAPVAPCERLPRYLDLGYYAQQSGVPFSTSSNLVSALHAALHGTPWPRKFDSVQRAGRWLRNELRDAGVRIVSPEACAAPCIATLQAPAGISSRRIGHRLKKAGFLVAYESAYLVERNWLQISLMGEFCEANLRLLVDALKGLLEARRPMTSGAGRLRASPSRSSARWY